MLQKKCTLIIMLIASAFCLCGCSRPQHVQAESPTKVPAISQPASPTSAGQTTVPEATAAPEATATPTLTATPTPTPSPTPIPAVPEAPMAVNTDTTTDTFLINRDYPLASTYKPTDLVVPDIPFSFNDLTADKRKLRKVAADALEELYQTALAEEGLSIYGVSGYRSYDRQYDIYGSNLITRGIRHTNLYSAAPGNSEHQTGLAIDVSCKSIGYNLTNSFATTPEGIWLKENCWRFGFILRYPKEKERITGYAYEPWHIRYVGVPLAYYLYTNDLTLEEYYGSPATQTLEELEDRPLIDLHTERFYLLYAATLGSEPYYLEDGSIMVSAISGYPYLKEKITNSDGKTITVNGTALYLEPVCDAKGNPIIDSNGMICYKKPYFDAEGNLWLDHNETPVFLEPLWNADGSLAYDTEGNLLYTEPVTDSNGMEYITETGSLLPKVPVRINGELIFDMDGAPIYYEPFTLTTTGELILDSLTGLPLFPSAYYDVPHNTLPLPAPEEDEEYPEQVDEELEQITDDILPEDTEPSEEIPEDELTFSEPY